MSAKTLSPKVKFPIVFQLSFYYLVVNQVRHPNLAWLIGT